MSRQLRKRLERLEAEQPSVGLTMMVRFQNGEPTHYLPLSAWNVERFLTTGQRPPLHYTYVVHVPAEWEPEAEGFFPIPGELDPAAERLIQEVAKLPAGGQLHRVNGQPGPVDDQARLQGHAELN